MIQTREITKQYATHKALEGVSISVPEGSVYGLLGPNGAGKTTLIRIINRITAPDSGELLFRGRKMTQKDIFKIGYLPEERGLYKKMKVGEQALYLSRLKGLSRHDAMQELKKWFRKFEIEGWWNKKVSELSKGMAQKVQFIVTVIHRPELLIFDEPFSGFDPINANLLKEEILERAKEGATVIFSTHNMSSVEEICDHITLINRSRNVLSGSIDQIRETAGNIYNLDYQGESQRLIEALAGHCQIQEQPSKGERKSALLHLPNLVKPKEIITLANQVVEIENFNRKILSMNEIFIRTVGENPQSNTNSLI